MLTLQTNMRLLTGGSDVYVMQRKYFSKWILGIGNGDVGEDNDFDMNVEILEDLLIKIDGNSLAAIVHSTYPSFSKNMHNPSYFQDMAILAPKNDIVDMINDYMLSLIPGDQKTYLSLDSPQSDNPELGNPDNIHTPEYLNTIVASGLLKHVLKLKVGVPILLLRNIDQSSGLCNGTRLIITKLRKYIVEGKVISGSNIGHKVFIPKLSLTPLDAHIPFKFQRRQLPLSLSFAMTINKRANGHFSP